MDILVAKNSENKAIKFIKNGGRGNDIIAIAMMKIDGVWEYWFHIGDYSSLKSAKKFGAKKMAKFGYIFDVA